VLECLLRAAERLIRHGVVLRVEIYRRDEETGPDSGELRYDPRSTVASQAELAPGSLEDIGHRRMGFAKEG
jgi:hypothetical protein